MGFDQYHEPPEELPAETRTFARLCASLKRRPGDRLVPAAPRGRARRRGAGDHGRRPGGGVQALRDGPRVPLAAQRRAGARSPRACSSRRATSSSTARRPRRRPGRRTATSRSLRWRRRRLARDRQPEGRGAMNHLLRGHAPLSDSNWQLLDEEARERLAGRSRRAGWSTSPARTAGSTRRPTSAAPRRSSARRRGRQRAAPARPAAGRAAGRLRDLPLGAADDDRGAVDVDLEPLDEAAHRIALAENVAVFHGWAKAGISGVAEPRRSSRSRSAPSAEELPALGRPRGRGDRARRGRGALRPRARPRASTPR